MDRVRSTQGNPIRFKAENRGLPSQQQEDSETEDESGDTYHESIADGDILDSEEEQKEGSRHESELLEKYEIWDNPEIQDFLDDVYDELVPFMARQDLEYDFLALDADVPFASSCPNGAIYFSRSMLENLDAEELLFFAAHELAHTELRHYASRQRRLADLRKAISAPMGSPTRHRFDVAAVLTVRHQEEFEADFQAGVWTDHQLGADALSTLHELCKLKAPESLNRSTHPSFPLRVESLNQKRPFPSPLSYLYSLVS